MYIRCLLGFNRLLSPLFLSCKLLLWSNSLKHPASWPLDFVWSDVWSGVETMSEWVSLLDDESFASSWRMRITCVHFTLYNNNNINYYYYTVSQKNKQNYFCYNYVKLPPNLTIFGTKMANCLKLYEVHSFPTSPNLCQCTTVLNADVLNCHITLQA